MHLTSFALEFKLEKNLRRFLTPAGETLITEAYRSFPAHAQVDEWKFFSAHAQDWCERNKNITHTVYPCTDTPPFLIQIKGERRKNPSVLDRVLGLWPFLIILLILLIISLAYFQN